eukprot:jgi/Bigna1/147021/aug1.127_g21729
MLRRSFSKIQPRRVTTGKIQRRTGFIITCYGFQKCKDKVNYTAEKKYEKMSFAHPKKPLKKATHPGNTRHRPTVDVISCVDGNQNNLRKNEDDDDPETIHLVDAGEVLMYFGKLDPLERTQCMSHSQNLFDLRRCSLERLRLDISRDIALFGAAIGTALALSSFGMSRKRLRARECRKKLKEVERKRNSILREAERQSKENIKRRKKRRKSAGGKKTTKASFSDKPCPGCRVKVFDEEMWKFGTIKSVTKVGTENDQRLRWLLEIQFAAGDKGRFEFPDQDIRLHYA